MWSSLHVYYEDPDSLLTKCVRPLVDSLRERELIGKFFFLRYWQRGLHVRLRWYSTDSDRGAHALQLVTEAVTRFMESAPVARTLSDGAYAALLEQFAAREGVTGDSPVAPANSLSVERYEPEYTKYGGAAGVAIAEAVFNHSSQAALALLPSFEGRASARLGVGFLCLLSAAQQFSLPRQKMAGFFEHYGKAWEKYPEQSAPRSNSELLAIAERLAPQARAALEDEPPKNAALGLWATATRDAARAISTQPGVLDQVQAPRADRDSRKAWLLAQYLHTHANRLGLLPADEAHLALLAAYTIRGLS